MSCLKIEVFAYNLFQTVWLKAGLITQKRSAVKLYKGEDLTYVDFYEVCNKRFYYAVLCRRILFQTIYMEKIIKEKDKNWNSMSDFYEYINRTCNQDNFFCSLTIFERIFATCAFVINLCFYNRENEKADIIKLSHIYWTMYFEAFTEEFYQKGGWSQLRKAASSYLLPFMFLQVFVRDPDNALIEVAEAIKKAYNNLKNTSIIDVCETVSKRWVESVETMYRSYSSGGEFAGYEHCLQAEYILNELKYLCRPCILTFLERDEECSERREFDSDNYASLSSTESQEPMSEANSFLVSSEGMYNVSTSSSIDDGSKIQPDNKDIINQSELKEPDDLVSNNHYPDVQQILDDMTKPLPPPPLYLPRSVAISDSKVLIFEMDSCRNANDTHSEGEDHA